MATKLIQTTSDPTTANTSAVQYINNETRWHNTSTGDVFMCVNSTAGTWAKIYDNAAFELDLRENWEYFDDFNQKALDETNGQWILNSGTDAQAVDPAISTAELGTIAVVTGDLDGTTAADASQIVLAIPVQADSGGLTFEARLKIGTAITGVSVFFGLTDVTTLEEPFTGATVTITSNASNAVGFLYDAGLTSKTWHMCGVDGDTDATTNGTLTSAPVADTYQILKCVVAASGESAEFFVDGVSKGSLTAAVCAASTNLYLTLVACATTTASKTVTADYLYISCNR